MAPYGATMIAVQNLEFCVSFLYLVGNRSPQKAGAGSAKRQLGKGLTELWDSLNKGTAPMKLSDAKKGVAHLLDEQTAAELEAFLDGPRNRLAHRYLIQSLPALADGGVRAMAPYVIELIEWTQVAGSLAKGVWSRAMEIVEELPDVDPPPPDVARRLEELIQITALSDRGPTAFS